MPVSLLIPTRKVSIDVPIKENEVHTYTFPGKFANPRNGGIPPWNPDVFRVNRVDQNLR